MQTEKTLYNSIDTWLNVQISNVRMCKFAHLLALAGLMSIMIAFLTISYQSIKQLWLTLLIVCVRSN
ncbi:MAG: hypothetical protein JWQ66_3057 [Mucilaginibacter sp.]|nr:hypothetical protein [Mucilaginibacter sp.]